MPVLRPMATRELTEEEGQPPRVTQFVNKGWPKSRDMKATVALLKVKLMRQFNLLKDSGADDLPNKPTLQGNIKVLGSCVWTKSALTARQRTPCSLQASGVLCGRRSPLS